VNSVAGNVVTPVAPVASVIVVAGGAQGETVLLVLYFVRMRRRPENQQKTFPSREPRPDPEEPGSQKMLYGRAD
jgi:hypothetical protein